MLRWLVWSPAVSLLPRYAEMGITDVVVNEGFTPKMPLLDAMDQIYRAGMRVWRYPAARMNPAGDPSLDLHPALAGFSLKDEPVMHAMTPAQWGNQAAEFRNALNGVSILGNLEGDKFSNTLDKIGARVLGEVKAYCEFCDIVLEDFYGFSRVRYNADKTFLSWYGTDPMFNSFRVLRKAAEGTRVKELGFVLEMGNQAIDKNSRAPTRGELRKIMWWHVLMGAKNIMIFPQRPNNQPSAWERNGSSNDCIPPELELEFYLNKPKLEDVELWGPPFTILDTPSLVSATWPGGKMITLDLATGNVTYTFGGGIQWELKAQSSVRAFSFNVYSEQVAAAAELSALRSNSKVRQLETTVVKLRSQLDRVRNILEEDFQ